MTSGSGPWMPVLRDPQPSARELDGDGSNGARQRGRALRIALLAGPMVQAPPIAYGGTERVVGALATELVRRGHDVTVYALGDSTVDATLRPIVDRALWRTGYRGDVAEQAVRMLHRLDRQRIRYRAIERFSASRMADRYEAIYRLLLDRPAHHGMPSGRHGVVSGQEERAATSAGVG